MLSIGDAAVFLGVSKTTLRRWDHSGSLLAYRTLGGHRRYKFCSKRGLVIVDGSAILIPQLDNFKKL